MKDRADLVALMPKRTYYNDDVAGELPVKILVDVRHKGELAVRVFDDETSFFKFLTGISQSSEESISAEQVWKYRAGGRLVEQNVIFRNKLHLMDVLDADDASLQ